MLMNLSDLLKNRLIEKFEADPETVSYVPTRSNGPLRLPHVFLFANNALKRMSSGLP